MLTTGEHQKLHQIEDGLRGQDREFAWRLGLLQRVLGWAAAGRQGYLLALAAVALALLRFVRAMGRLLLEAGCCGALVFAPPAVTALGDLAWPGGECRRAPGDDRSPEQAARFTDRGTRQHQDHGATPARLAAWLQELADLDPES